WPRKKATSVAEAAGAVAPRRSRSQRSQVVSTTRAPGPERRKSSSASAKGTGRARPRPTRLARRAHGQQRLHAGDVLWHVHRDAPPALHDRGADPVAVLQGTQLLELLGGRGRRRGRGEGG